MDISFLIAISHSHPPLSNVSSLYELYAQMNMCECRMASSCGYAGAELQIPLNVPLTLTMPTGWPLQLN